MKIGTLHAFRNEYRVNPILLQLSNLKELIMKLFKKVLAGVAVAAALVTSAHASPITVDGVTWDPNAVTDFTSQSINMRQIINTTTGELTGYGIITAING